MEGLLLGEVISHCVLKNEDSVIYEPIAPKSFTIPRVRTGILFSDQNGHGDQSLQSEKLAWRYTGIIEDQGAKFVSDGPTFFKISLLGKTGFYNGINVLNDTCKVMFSNISINAQAYCMTETDYDLLPDSMKKCKENPVDYYLASTKVEKNQSKHSLLIVSNGNIEEREMFNFGTLSTVKEYWCTASIRPVVYIPLDVKVSLVPLRSREPVVRINSPLFSLKNNF